MNKELLDLVGEAVSLKERRFMLRNRQTTCRGDLYMGRSGLSYEQYHVRVRTTSKAV
jgi:hypothetical protein